MSTGINPIIPGFGFIGPFSIGSDGTPGQVLSTDGGRGLTWVSVSADHGGLTGLGDDDHLQYLLGLGRSGGQTLIGDTASGGNLTLQSTSHATKGKLLFGTSAYDEVNNRLGVGTASPTVALDVVGLAAIRTSITVGSTGLPGDVFINNSTPAARIIIGFNGGLNPGVFLGSSSFGVGFASGTTPGTNDTNLSRVSAGVLGVGTGAFGSTAGSLALLAVQGKDASGSNVVADNLTLKPGVSTGNATPSSVIIQSSVAGSSGSSAQTLADTLKVTNGRVEVTAASDARLRISLTGGQLVDLQTDVADALLLKDRSGNTFLRALKAVSWTDNANGSFFQLSQGNGLFTGASGAVLSRFMVSSALSQITAGSYATAPVPTGLFEILDSSHVVKFHFGTSAVTLGDAVNIVANTSTGTKIGTATTQKLGFWNATPVVQPTTIVDADGTLADITTKFNSLLSKLETIGLLAAA